MSNSNDNDSHNEQVELACQGFRNSVQAYCRRYIVAASSSSSEKKKVLLPKDVEDLVSHSSYFLRNLIGKRRSLENGLCNLRRNLWPIILDRFHKHPTERAALLQHFLEQCLRLHDGLLLLVSGECRHQGDIRRANNSNRKETPFRSKLKLLTFFVLAIWLCHGCH